MPVKKKATVRKTVKKTPKWLVQWDAHYYNECSMYYNDKDFEESLEDARYDGAPYKVYRLDKTTEFKYTIPALSGVLKEVK